MAMTDCCVNYWSFMFVNSYQLISTILCVSPVFFLFFPLRTCSFLISYFIFYIFCPLTLENYPSRVIYVQSSFLVSSILLDTNIALIHHHCLALFASVCGREPSWSSLSVVFPKAFSSASPNPSFELVHDSVISSPYNTSPPSITYPANLLTD